jgi:hypothetical protein
VITDELVDVLSRNRLAGLAVLGQRVDVRATMARA